MSKIRANTHEGYFFFGKLIRTHGYRGGMKALLDVDQPQEYRELDMVFIELRGSLVPWVVESIHMEGAKANIKLQDVSTMEAAEKMVGSILYLPVELLPKLRGNKFYYHEVTGFQVVDRTHGSIGSIERVLELPGNPLFVIRFNDKEILLPITDAIIKKVDRKKKQIETEAPEGLLEIYL